MKLLLSIFLVIVSCDSQDSQKKIDEPEKEDSNLTVNIASSAEEREAIFYKIVKNFDSSKKDLALEELRLVLGEKEIIKMVGDSRVAIWRGEGKRMLIAYINSDDVISGFDSRDTW